MAVLAIQDLRNKVMEMFTENHERAIDGMITQEMLLDIIDSITNVTGTDPGLISLQQCNEVSLLTGINQVSFADPFPAGTTYIILKEVISVDGGFSIGGDISDKTINGFKINVPEEATLIYLAIKKS